MEEKRSLLIYNRREMGILVVLAVTVALFAFTLGVHLGKKVLPRRIEPAPTEAAPVATQLDEVPGRQELAEQSKGAAQGVDETLTKVLQDEVTRSRIALEVPRQIEFPEKTKSRNGGATTEKRGADAVKADGGKYTIQVGSFPKVEEAREQLHAIEALGLEPQLHSAQVKGKGQWFRIYIGQYATKEEADQAGQGYRTRKLIRSYVVARFPEKN